VCQERTETRNPSDTPDSEFIYIDISSVDNKLKRIIEPKTLYGKDAPSRARQVVRTDDVIVSTTRPNLNAVAIIPQEFDNQICSTGFCVLRAKEGLLPDYLFAFVQCSWFIESLSELVKGALYPAVTDRQVREQLIPLPSVQEQKRIATMLQEQLAAVEQARIAAVEQLEAAKALQDAYLREVFNSDEAREWEKVRLGDVCSIYNGSTPSTSEPNYWENGNIVWVTPADMGKLEDKYISSSARLITKDGYESCNTTLLEPNSLVISTRAPIGYLGIAAVPLCTNQGCKGITPGPQVDSLFLYYTLKNAVPELQTLGSGATFAEVSKTQLERFEIALPALDEQKRIAGVLDEQLAAVEQVRSTIEDQLNTINQLPAALLRKVFSGELLT
jgi:type I restriction enzyme S subunit